MVSNHTSTDFYTANPFNLGEKKNKAFCDDSSKSETLYLKIPKNNFYLIEIINSIKDIKGKMPGHEEIYSFLSNLEQNEKRKLFIVNIIPKHFFEYLIQNICLKTKFDIDQHFKANEINLIFCKIPNLLKKSNKTEIHNYENKQENLYENIHDININNEKEKLLYSENDEDSKEVAEPTMKNKEIEDNKILSKEEKIIDKKVESIFKINQNLETMKETEVKEEEKIIDKKVKSLSKINLNLETMKETEAKKDENIVDEKDIINIFLPNIKISSLKEENDILLFDIKLLMEFGNLDKILKYFSNDCHLKDWISPFMFENSWYIPLPNWANLIKSFNGFYILCIILEIKILINFEYYYIKGKNIPISLFKHIDYSYEENMIKINVLVEDPNIINKIFSKQNLDIVINIATQTYFGNSTNLCEKDRIDLPNYFKEQLSSLKKEIEGNENKKEGSILEQLKYLFNKITYYTFFDVLDIKNVIYINLRKSILNYSSIEEKIGNEILNINRNISYNNAVFKIFKILILNNFEENCKKLLENKYKIDFKSYGSNLYRLNLVSSDIDIRICYEEIDKSTKSDKEILDELYDLLIDEKENIKKDYLEIVEIKKIKEKNIKVPLIKLKFSLINIIYDYLHLFNNAYQYLKIQDITEVKIDISFSHYSNSNEIENINKMTKLIEDDLKKHPLIKPIVLIFKLILEINHLNSANIGGLNSSSVFFLVKNIIKTNEKDIIGTDSHKIGKIYYLFLKKFSNYNFTYGIDENGLDFSYIQTNKDKNKDKKFMIKNPIVDHTNKLINIAYGCTKTEDIKNLFNNLLIEFEKNKRLFLNIQKNNSM